MSSPKKPAPASNDPGKNYEQQVSKIQEYLERWNQIRKNNKGDIQNPQSQACKAEIRDFFKEHLKVKEKDVQDLIDNHYITVYKLIYDIYILDKVSNNKSESKSQDQKLTMKEINKSLEKIVYIQSILRRKIALSQYKKKLQSQKKELQSKLGSSNMPEEACMKMFAAQLADKKLTPEAFFRVCDQYGELKVPVPTFTKKLQDFGIVLTKGQQQRIVNVLDEDLEQVITHQEFFDAIEAYNISGEKHKNPDGSPYLPFEIRVLIKLDAIMKERDLSSSEVFNSCDIDRSGTIKIDELAKFIEGISRDFKQKEAFAMMRYLDIDNNGSIDKAEFQKQMQKVEKYYESYQRMQAAQFYQQSTGNMRSGVQDIYQQSANLVKGSMGMASFKVKDTISDARNSAQNFASAQRQRASNAFEQAKEKAASPFREGFSSIQKKWNNSPVRGWFGGSSQKQEADGPVPQSQKSLKGSSKAPLKGSVQKQSTNKPQSAKQTRGRQSSKSREVIEDDMFAEEHVGGGDQAFAPEQDEEPENDLLTIEDVLPGHYSLSPRSKQDEIAKKLYIVLRNKNFKPQTVYRMADAYNNDEVSSKQLVGAFSKLLPDFDQSVFVEACKAFGKKGRDGEITKDDFLAVFEPDQRERDFVPKSNNRVASDYNRGREEDEFAREQPARSQQVRPSNVDPNVDSNWIKKLDEVMLQEGISPKVAFLNADLNKNGKITTDELRQALKGLLPNEDISLSDIKKMAMAFDTDRNGYITEQEFIQQFASARLQPVIIRKVVASEMEADPEFPGETVRHTSPAISKKKNPKAAQGTQNPLQVELEKHDKMVLRTLRALENRFDIKEVLSQSIEIDEDGFVATQALSKTLRTTRTSNGALLQELEYLPFLAYLERGHKGRIKMADLIALLDNCQEDSDSEGLLEVILIAWALDNVHRAKSTIMFLSQKCQIERMTALNVQKAIPKIIRAVGIQAKPQNLIRLCQLLEEGLRDTLMFEDFCKEINGYRQMEQRDEDLPEFDLSRDSAIARPDVASPDDSVLRDLAKGKKKQNQDLMDDSEDQMQEEEIGGGDQAFADDDVAETENFIKELKKKMPKINRGLNDFFAQWNNDVPVANFWLYLKNQGINSSDSVQKDIMFEMAVKKKGNMKPAQFERFARKHSIPYNINLMPEANKADEYENFKEDLRSRMPQIQEGITGLFKAWNNEVPIANLFMQISNQGIEVSEPVKKDFMFETAVKKNSNISPAQFERFCKQNDILYRPKKPKIQSQPKDDSDGDQVDEYQAFVISLQNKMKAINMQLNDFFESRDDQANYKDLFKFLEKKCGVAANQIVQKRFIVESKMKKDGIVTTMLFLAWAKKESIPYKAAPQPQTHQEDEDEFEVFVDTLKLKMKSLEGGINKLFVAYENKVPIDNFFLQLRNQKVEVTDQAKKEFMYEVAVKKGGNLMSQQLVRFCKNRQIKYNPPALKEAQTDLTEIIQKLRQVVPKINEDINQMFSKFKMKPQTKALMALLATKGQIKLEKAQRDALLEQVGADLEGEVTLDALLNFCKKNKIPFRPPKKELSWEDKMREVLQEDPALKQDLEEFFRNNGYEVKFDDLLDFLETFDIKLPEEDEELEDEFDPEVKDTVIVKNFNKAMAKRNIPLDIQNLNGVKGIMKKGEKAAGSAKKKTVVLASDVKEEEKEEPMMDESVDISREEQKKPRVKKSSTQKQLKKGSSMDKAPIKLATQKSMGGKQNSGLQRKSTQAVSEKSVAVQKKEELQKQNSKKAMQKDIDQQKEQQKKENAKDEQVQQKYKEKWIDKLEDKQQKWNNAFIDWMDEMNMEIPYKEFFDWFETNYNMVLIEPFRKIVAADIDDDKIGKITCRAFTDFCDDYDIPFNPEQRIEKGDGILLEMDGETYQTDKDVDYYRGIDSILNSEKAALFMAEHLYNKIPENQLFFDDDFGPKTRADRKNGALAMYFDGVAPRGYADPEGVVWKYATELSDLPEQFVDDGAGSNDVKQGQLGDCWFIGALSVLATKDHLLRGGVKNLKEWANKTMTDEEAQQLTIGVYPPIFHKYRKKGLYVFRFFKDFLWRYVIVDMRLPCNEYNGMPVFGRCTEAHELWVPLIEKAYAKIHGCYQTLISGFLDDGLSDLTGQVSEKLTIQHPKSNTFPSKEVGDKETFWKFLMDRKAEGSMMGCSKSGGTEGPVFVDGEQCGVLSGHAYGLIDVFEIPDPGMTNERKTHRLLRIRNPWGKGEWKLKWSDESDELDTHWDKVQKYFRTLPEDEQFKKGEDGTFLMCYSDWRNLFNKVFISVNFPDHWNAIRYSSMFEIGCSGGLPGKSAQSKVDWASNPQFHFEAKKDMEIFLSLGQDDGRRQQDNGKYFKFPYSELIHPVCLTVCKANGKEKVEKFDKSIVLATSVLKEHREVSCRLKIEKGHYIFIPSARAKGSEGPFFLSIYYDQDDDKVDSIRLDKIEHHHPIAEEEEDVRISDFRMQYIVDRIPFMLADEDNCRIDSQIDIVASVPEGDTSAMVQAKDEEEEFE